VPAYSGVVFPASMCRPNCLLAPASFRRDPGSDDVHAVDRYAQAQSASLTWSTLLPLAVSTSLTSVND
jgi:hypothetical protein